MSDKKILAIVPARGGSKGLPLKNIRKLGGFPLLAWPIKAGLGASLIDKVIVSTDVQEFADVAKKYGAEVPFLRPAHLASDTASSIDFILHAIDHFKKCGEVYDYVVLLEPTSPLTESSDIDEALNILIDNSDVADSIVGVSVLEAAHPAFTVSIENNGLLKPFLSKDFNVLPRRQDLQELYFLEGSLYISTVSALKITKSFCHNKTLPYVTAKYKSFEVDDFVDFVCIEAINNNLDKIKTKGH